MAHLQMYKNREGKFAVQVDTHHRKGVCLFLCAKHRCKWMPKTHSEYTPFESPMLQGARLLESALYNPYQVLTEVDRGRLLSALNPDREDSTMTTTRTKLDTTATVESINPNTKKRGEAAKRFALYQIGQTIAEYLELGGKRGDIAHDVKAGFITLRG